MQTIKTYLGFVIFMALIFSPVLIFVGLMAVVGAGK
jgi:hypothetical protein